eukprot:TRINITY_DN14442_c1_g1_i1.p1 TRINITY_DN14442_c1_g1~~TRINITY_DN14442_c1_g1_i1.p1  ORF type:complete len:218 (+),score=25.12 TRINITY_DN14442_c1_g1_i1:29-655(+)
MCEQLRTRIAAEAQDMGRGILRVNSFLNHQVDVSLMDCVARDLACHFVDRRPTRVLTAEASGIPPAIMVAMALGNIPVVYAKKGALPATMLKSGAYAATVRSRTRGTEHEIHVSKDFLDSSDRVLIVDDFLATGTVALALCDIVAQAGATVLGIAVVIEKRWEGGRAAVLQRFPALPIFAGAVILSMQDGVITLEGDQTPTDDGETLK